MSSELYTRRHVLSPWYETSWPIALQVSSRTAVVYISPRVSLRAGRYSCRCCCLTSRRSSSASILALERSCIDRHGCVGAVTVRDHHVHVNVRLCHCALCSVVCVATQRHIFMSSIGCCVLVLHVTNSIISCVDPVVKHHEVHLLLRIPSVPNVCLYFLSPSPAMRNRG